MNTKANSRLLSGCVHTQIFVAASAFVAFLDITSAQSTRQYRAAQVADAATVFVMVEHEASLRLVHVPTGAVSMLPNAVWVPGALLTVTGPGTTRVHMVGGRDNRNVGIVQFVHDDCVGGYSLLGSVPVLGADVCGIAYSSTLHRLYLLDAAQHRILSAPYSLGGSLPSTWTSVATTQNLPRLLDAAQCTISMVADGAEPQLVLAEVGPVVPETVTFTLKASGEVQIDRTSSGSRTQSSLEEMSVTAGATSLTMYGPPNSPVSAVEVDGSVAGVTVGTATTDSNGLAVLTLAQPLDMAKVYAARDPLAAEPTEPYVVPLMRWGSTRAEDMPMCGGLQLRPFGNIGCRFYAGNSDYYFSLRSEPAGGSTVAVPASYTAHLVLGIHGVHSIAQTPRGPMLQGGWLGSDAMDVVRPNGAAAIVDAPVPNDSGLVGLVVLAQWVVAAPPGSGPEKYYLSDLVGVRIRGAAVENPHQMPPPEAAQALAVVAAPSVTQQQRFQSWMKHARFKPATASFLERVQRGLAPR
jgi:hypothetical protein